MIWAEVLFSSMLLLSAFYLVSLSPPPASPLPDWVAYQHLEDSAALLANIPRQNSMASGAGGAQPAGTNNPVQIPLIFESLVQSRLDAFTSNTPYCMEFVLLGQGGLPIVSCRGAAALPSSISRPPAAASTTSPVWIDGNLRFFSLRQWSDSNP